MKGFRFGPGLIILMVTLIFSGIACTNYTIPGKGSGKIEANSCEGCHTDLERLIAVHTPDTGAPVGGCGGEAPHYEPYDRVFLGGEGYDAFKASGHYGVGCTGCHNGVGDSGDKNEAHSGDWISSPSLSHQEKCAGCHQNQSDNFMTSLHNGTGQKRKVAMRAGLEGAHQFDQLPEHHQEAYDAKCATCHGTCGNCHLVRPAIAGGGLTDGHNFIKKPDWYSVCVSCHVSRGGHAFLGAEAEPDVHRDEHKMDCLSCHDGHELHGDGQPVEQRYDYAELPTCIGCHEEMDDDLKDNNSYHMVHYESFQCQVCHSQEYNNCGACHIKDGHAEFGPYMDYKIALNTLPDLKDGKFALARRTLAHPDNWVGYGEELEYDNFDVLPTYNYTTPHNILEWTKQTTVAEGSSCSSSCHIRNEGGELINSELYLWADSLETWEVDATSPYTVDGELPSKWFAEKKENVQP